MLRFDGEDIAADRFCLFSFVEGAIEFRFCDGLGDSRSRNALHFISHGLPSQLTSIPRREICPSSTTFDSGCFRIVEISRAALSLGISSQFFCHDIMLLSSRVVQRRPYESASPSRNPYTISMVNDSH